MARALEELPKTGEAMARGRLSFSQARALTRVATPEQEEALLEDGTRVSAETSRRLSCDAGLVGVLRGEGGEVLDVGRKRRTVPPALRRALEVRDRGCRFPGCGLRFTDAHHITH